LKHARFYVLGRLAKFNNVLARRAAGLSLEHGAKRREAGVAEIQRDRGHGPAFGEPGERAQERRAPAPFSVAHADLALEVALERAPGESMASGDRFARSGGLGLRDELGANFRERLAARHRQV